MNEEKEMELKKLVKLAHSKISQYQDPDEPEYMQDDIKTIADSLEKALKLLNENK